MIEKDDDDKIEKALNNLQKDEFEDSDSSTTTTSSQTNTTDSDPDIQPSSETVGNVGHGGTLEGKDRYWEKKCRAYAKKFIGGQTEYDPIDVNLNKITWYVSPKMTRASGKCEYNKPRKGHQRIKVSGHMIQNSDWERVQKTIRHELVHAWQAQNDRAKGHGWSFRQWTDKLDISTRADNPATQDYKYELHCPNCGQIGGRQKKCKTVKQIVKGNSRRYCTNCGKHTSGELEIVKNGSTITSMWKL